MSKNRLQRGKRVSAGTQSLVALFFLLWTSAVAGAGDVYDVVIVGGRVMDPASGYDQVANLGIRDDRIASITMDPIVGTQRIDATGHVVAPGFIDTHYQ